MSSTPKQVTNTLKSAESERLTNKVRKHYRNGVSAHRVRAKAQEIGLRVLADNPELLMQLVTE